MLNYYLKKYLPKKFLRITIESLKQIDMRHLLKISK